MSRRQRGSRRAYDRPLGNAESAPWSGISPSEDAPEPSLREQLERASVAARALLPLRFFFGVTFVYAGLDKLLDPAFFDAASPASIQGQLAAFARVSPVAFLVRPAEPFAVPLGLLIALAEIAIGLGALSGLAFRLAAAGGTALSFLFWLTASWTTHPYYYGADLPYAFGWLVLALAGDAGLLVPAAVRRMGQVISDGFTWNLRESGHRVRPPRGTVIEPTPSRRLVLQAGVLGGAAIALASMAVPLRFLRGRSGDDQPASAFGSDGTANGQAGGPTSVATDAPTPVASGPAGATTTPFQPSGLTLASISTVDSRGATRIRIPADAPAPLVAGDPGIIVKLADGSYVAYDATCTHQGCRVGWDPQDGILLCPCHGAAFDPADHGAVLGGPTDTPLMELPLVVDKQAGTISLKA